MPDPNGHFTFKSFMARSQQSLGKRENEKKKEQKKKEKEARKEERKSSTDKGKSLEDMMVYVDHEGNLVSAPPDPSRRAEVNAEDIEVGVARQRELTEEELQRKGTVTFFNQSKGYGFIRDHESQESLFVHINDIAGPVNENDRVTFEKVKGTKGWQAVKVRK